MAVILHPLGQRVADQDDPVPFAKLQLRLVGRESRRRRQEGQHRPGGQKPVANRDLARLVIAVRASRSKGCGTSVRSRGRAGFQGASSCSGGQLSHVSHDTGGPRSWWIMFSGRENRTAAHLSCVPQRERAVKGGRLSAEPHGLSARPGGRSISGPVFARILHHRIRGHADISRDQSRTFWRMTWPTNRRRPPKRRTSPAKSSSTCSMRTWRVSTRRSSPTSSIPRCSRVRST